jgi:hypothetical protein
MTIGWAEWHPDENGEVRSFELQVSQRNSEVSGELRLASRTLPVIGRADAAVDSEASLLEPHI